MCQRAPSSLTNGVLSPALQPSALERANLSPRGWAFAGYARPGAPT
jgi:hypothetical protein